MARRYPPLARIDQDDPLVASGPSTGRRWVRVLGAVVVGFVLWAGPWAGAGVAARPPVTEAAAAAPTASPEERLAANHAPVLAIARQSRPCDDEGDPFAPAPVEIVLGDPEVTLRAPDAEPSRLTSGPTAADLFDGDADLFLDYPPNPRRPGCA